jgi:DNA-binding transcriptional regulator YdaS (Cro superfamily)
LGENRTFRFMTLSDYLKQPGVTAVGLAARLNVDHSRVLRWAKGTIPAERVAAVSAATGIPAAELRPDLAAAFLSETT